MNQRRRLNKKPNILIFSGGSGIRDIHVKLAKHSNVTRILPVCDNGGSSKFLRQHFDIMPVGDVRQALVTAAYSQRCQRDIIRLFNWRLPEQVPSTKLHKELAAFCSARHPIMQQLPQKPKEQIIFYLTLFKKHARGLAIGGGSIGNFLLVGAYLKHGHINSAITAIKEMFAIEGNVWPVSLVNDLQLMARLDNGRKILGQAAITTINRRHITSKINSVEYVGQTLLPPLNPLVVEALKRADMIVYGPGSFFTSVLPHLMVENIANLIANQSVPKVFIGNLLQGNECFGYSVHELVRVFLNNAKKISKQRHAKSRYINHVLANKRPSQHCPDKKYLIPGRGLSGLNKHGISARIQDLEDPWWPGIHDANLIDETLLNIMQDFTEDKVKIG